MMMDESSIIYAGLVVGGVMMVLLIGLWMLSTESSTVSISGSPVPTQSPIRLDLTLLPEAAQSSSAWMGSA
jgi:hypothetical protein